MQHHAWECTWLMEVASVTPKITDGLENVEKRLLVLQVSLPPERQLYFEILTKGHEMILCLGKKKGEIALGYYVDTGLFGDFDNQWMHFSDLLTGTGTFFYFDPRTQIVRCFIIHQC